MTGVPERGGAARLTGLGAAGVVVVFLLVWPLANGLMLTNSGVVYGNRVAQGHRQLDEILALSWAERWFRPIDMVGALLADPVTADSRITMLLQIPPLLAIIAGIAVALRRLVPRWQVPFALAIVWLGLHPSTTVSLWPGDSITQTWVTAGGVWLSLVLWRAIERLRDGAPVTGHVAALTVMCAAGLLMKEQIVGWCAGGAGITVLAFALASRRPGRAPIGAWIAVIAPLILVPAVWLGIRYAFGGLAQITAESDDRYRPELGINIIRNVAMAGGGSFALGPTHALFDRDAAMWIRSLPLAGTALSATAAGLIWLLVAIRRTAWDGGPRFLVFAAVVLMALCGALTALPTQRVSELYLMGPNIGVAIAVALGLRGLWDLGSAAGGGARSTARVLALLIAAGMFAVGAFGLASRAVHFRIVWAHGAALRSAVVAHQQAGTPTAAPKRIVVPASCREGRVFGQYVLPPSEALSLKYTEEWLTAQSPDRPIRFVAEGEPGDPVIDCSGLEAHPVW